MIGSLDFGALRAAYASGNVTPEVVIREVYRRINARGVCPVWISLVPENEALARARLAPRGSLYGLPFAVKDNIDAAGLPTTCACPEFSYVPARSATVVERLEAQGAILIGKANLDQFATGLVGVRSPYGIPASTFSPDHISGGSSSGSAVAVAGGLVSFALGTDTAGSGRVPAAFNNIVGLKPTKGALSTRGVVPACRTQDAVSIFALTVGDAAEVMQAAAAFDAEDAYSRSELPPFQVKPGPTPLRVGIPSGALEFLGDEASEGLYAEACQHMAGLGADLVEIDFTPFREAAKLLYAGPWVAERLAAINAFAQSKSEAIHETVRGIILGAQDISAVTAFEGFYRLSDLVREAAAQWAKMDVLLLPTAATTYKIADVLADPVRLNSNLGLYTNFTNLMDLCALAIPAGMRPDGLPFGVTLMAKAREDGRLAALGDALHRTLDGAKLGATSVDLASTAAIEVEIMPAKTVCIAVVGAHLTGQPLNSQLIDRGAILKATAHTAPGYSLFALPDSSPPKPGLIFDGKGPGGVEVEIWELSEAGFGSFVALIPAPLGIGTLTLADGLKVKGFLCEAHALVGAEDISSWGGWRAWLKHCNGGHSEI